MQVWLGRAADEPVNPVFFDARMGEYQLRHSDGSYSILYHCPWCGGSAPRSKRSSFFAVVPRAEWDRLAALTSDVKTIEEAVQRFGPAGEGEPQGLTIYPADSREPARAESFAMRTFSNLSKVANVVLNDYGPKGIAFSFHAKAVPDGKPRRRKPSGAAAKRDRKRTSR